MREEKRKDIHNSDIPLVCQACEARHGGICAALNPDQLTELNKYTKRTVHEPGSNLNTVEMEAGSYANILGGVVKLTKLMADGRQQIVGLQFAPDFLGRPFLETNNVTAEASVTTRLCSFPKKVIDDFVSDVPEMEHILYEQSLRELDEARDWMLMLGRKSALEKVASFLLLILMNNDPERQNNTYPITIELPLKRGDIADFLGVTIETVSRQLTNLRKNGVIEIVDRKSVTINSAERLKSAAGDI